IYDAWTGGSTLLSWLFVAFELFLAGWLISGWRLRQASGVATLVLIAFTFFILIETNAYAPRPCGCFGGKEVQRLGDEEIRASLFRSAAFNAYFILAGFWLF